MTRERDTNEAFVVLTDDQTPADVVSAAVARTWIDRPAIAHRVEAEAGVGLAVELDEPRPTNPPLERRAEELNEEERQREALLRRAYEQNRMIDPPTLSL